MKLAFVVAEQYRDPELDNTIAQLKNHDIIITSSKTGIISGADGGSCEATLLTNDIVIENFDGIVLIGGPGMSQEIAAKSPLYSAAMEKVKAFNSAGKLVAAICISPIILADAGIVSGKTVTVWNDGNSTQKTQMEAAGATCTLAGVEKDSNIITANGPTAAPDFGKAIAEFE